jgi:hypothetical protein
MNRRRFLRLGAGVAAVGTLHAYAEFIGLSANAKNEPKDMTPAEFHEARRFVQDGLGRHRLFRTGHRPRHRVSARLSVEQLPVARRDSAAS